MKLLALIRLVTFGYVLFVAGITVCVTNGWFGMTFEWVRVNIGDKFMHFFLVGLLALLINLSIRASALRTGFITVQRGTAVLLVLATLEEFSQKLFANRTFDLVDLSCNIAGILILGSLAWPVAGWLGIRNDRLINQQHQEI